MSALSPPVRQPPQTDPEAQKRRNSGARRPGRSTTAFPHASTIESSLGVRLPGTWQVDPAACQQRGVPGFTDGLTTSFATPTPPLRVAAHEAAHALQHAGLTRDHGLGAERHADAIAGALAAELPADRWIDPSRGSAVPTAVRPYTEFEAEDLEEETVKNPAWKGVKFPARVSSNFETLTDTDGGYHSKNLFAAPGRVTAGNSALVRQSSPVTLVPNSSSTIDLFGQKLVKVSIRVEGHPDDKPCLSRDCGFAAMTIMGHDATGMLPAARYGDNQLTSATAQPNFFRNEIIASKFGDKDDPMGEYRKDKDADRFDEELKINRHASPRMGEAYVTTASPERQAKRPVKGKEKWDHHFATVILEAGDDHVTLENAAYVGTPELNDGWYFHTYGPASNPGQTFHDQYTKPTDFAGPRSEGSMTMVAQIPILRDLPAEELQKRLDDDSWPKAPIKQELYRRAVIQFAKDNNLTPEDFMKWGPTKAFKSFFSAFSSGS